MRHSSCLQVSTSMIISEMRISGFLLLLLILPTIVASGQKAGIDGLSTINAGEKIILKKIYNPLSGNSVTLDTMTIDDQGRFFLEIPIDVPIWIQLDLGIYEGILFLNPGYQYTIDLPKNTRKTESEIRSPFFQPTPIHLRVKEERYLAANRITPLQEDLNSKIFRFDSVLYEINLQVLTARGMQRLINTDSMLLAMEVFYSNDTSAYFANYRKYRYGLVQINSGGKMLKDIYCNYLSSDHPDITNPAYSDLFNKLYEKFLFYYSQTIDGMNVNSTINNYHSLYSLRNELKKHPAIPNNTLADLVIMKEVNESFYRDYYYKEALLIILDSIIIQPGNPEFSMMALDIRSGLTNMMIGTAPPKFSLVNQQEKRIGLSDFEGKYVYLNFCTPDNYSCQKEYPFLRSLHEKHHEYLEVVTIMVTEKMDTMQEFIQRNNYTWTILFYENNEELLKSFKIRTYPTCYLIGPDGLLIQSPATLPTEGFEQQLFRIMRSRGDL